MKIRIERNGEHAAVADVVDLIAIPAHVFEVTRVYGSGTYVAIIEGGEEQDNGPAFKLTTEWLEDD